MLHLIERKEKEKVAVVFNAPAKRWSVGKVEDIVHRLGIRGCEIVYQRKLVKLNNPHDLYSMLVKIVPSELDSASQARVSRRDHSIRLDIGGWRFETHENGNGA